MNQSSVIERLKKYVLAHPNITNDGLIKGLDSSTGEIVVVMNGEDKRITIDELENGILEKNIPSVQAHAEEPIEIMEEEEIETLDTPINQNNNIENLQEMSEAIKQKDEASINNALSTFAINEKTGSIDINKAIKIITDNSINNVVECIKNGKDLPSELSDYDIKGNIISNLQDSITDMQSLVDKSFNNILVYVEAAKLRNIVYNEAQIALAKNKYSTSINDRLNVLGLNKKEEVKIEENDKTLSMDLKPDKNLKKAGFADIFILTIIISIYAAIIVNLISKIK